MDGDFARGSHREVDPASGNRHEAHDVGSRMRRGVEDRQVERLPPRRAALRSETGDTFERARRRLAPELLGRVVAGTHLLVHAILRAAPDGVMRLVLEKSAPGRTQRRPLVGCPEGRAEGRPWLGPALEQRFGPAVPELERQASRPDAGQQVRRARAEQLAAEGRGVGGQQRREILEEPTHHRPAGRASERLGRRARMGLGQSVVEAVHQEDRPVVARRRKRTRDLRQHARGGGGVERQTRRREVALRQAVREHGAAVGGGPQVRGGQGVDLVAPATPVDEGPEPEAAKELRELRRMAEGVGAVRDARHRPHRAADAPALEQVADVGLP